MKTGLDVVKAAILGAESFGFGTAPMIAMGCKYLQHLNNCATGFATQNDKLREDHFVGDVERVVNFFRFVAEETREWMASLGVSKLEDLIGRVDLLEHLDGSTEKQSALNLQPITWIDETAVDQPQSARSTGTLRLIREKRLRSSCLKCFPPLKQSRAVSLVSQLQTVIALLVHVSLAIAKRYGNAGMEESPITLKLEGIAGQSYVWNAGGLHMYLAGDCNDYVGKGMAGGKLVVFPPEGSQFESKARVS